MVATKPVSATHTDRSLEVFDPELSKAIQLEQRSLQLALTIIVAIGAFVMVIALLMFGLDGIQMRANVTEEAKGGFDRLMLKSIITMVLQLTVLTLLALKGWKVSRTGAGATPPKGPELARAKKS